MFLSYSNKSFCLYIFHINKFRKTLFSKYSKIETMFGQIEICSWPSDKSGYITNGAMVDLQIGLLYDRYHRLKFYFICEYIKKMPLSKMTDMTTITNYDIRHHTDINQNYFLPVTVSRSDITGNLMLMIHWRCSQRIILNDLCIFIIYVFFAFFFLYR